VGDRPAGNRALPVVSAQVDQICDRFEAAWRSGAPPRIESFLVEAEAPERPILLRELILLELVYRSRAGDEGLREEYQRRFPRYANVVRSVFAQDLAAERGSGGSASDLPAELPDDSWAATDSDTTLVDGGVLAKVWPFSELPRSLTVALLDQMHQQSYAPGDVLIRQGEPSRHLLVLVDGEVEVLVEDQARRHDVAKVGVATILGEMGLLTDEPCTATVVAKTAINALVLPAERFHRLASRHHVLWHALSRLVAQRLGQGTVDILAGKTLHGYRIQRCLARGGMAVVYEAEDVRRGRSVALKMMSHRFAHDLEVQSRFEREVEICRALRHPNIARTYGHFTAFGTSFMVMELCLGETLAERIRQSGAMDEPEARAILGQLARALDYAHQRGICHRDVKPSNVMVSPEGTVKLMDFGLAKSVESVELTSHGCILGTPRYMPPEQLAGQPVDHRADIFALGCVAYELLAGRQLFDASDLLAILSQQLRWTLPPADEIRPGLSPDLYEVLRQALARDPQDRLLSPMLLYSAISGTS